MTTNTYYSDGEGEKDATYRFLPEHVPEVYKYPPVATAPTTAKMGRLLMIVSIQLNKYNDVLG